VTHGGGGGFNEMSHIFFFAFKKIMFFMIFWK
jgi:hypothetical protein